MTTTAIGQVLGLVGMAMFALNLVLSARLKRLEGLFGGMNKIYIAHHILGGLAFVLLLLHPLFIVGKYLPNAAMQAVKILFLGTTWDCELWGYCTRADDIVSCADVFCKAPVSYLEIYASTSSVSHFSLPRSTYC